LLAARATELGLEPVPCPTNFLPIRLPSGLDPADLVAALAERGFLVKGPFSAPCLADCIRVTVGPPLLMGEFAAALREAVGVLSA
jgi:histidinol-phosphate/aromatic aminotransferase/cobyric acid decarboxylase-like protein